MFDAFVFEPRPGNRSAGLGLGLHICRRLVELMDGDIGYRAAPGGGSIFRVALPLPASAMPVPDPAPAGTDPPQTILLVEDDDITRQVTAALLANHGHRVTVAASAQAAEALAASRSFDLVLMDLHLGSDDDGDNTPGLVAARRIRALPDAGARLRIYALTADARPERRAACHDAGMDGVLVKPLSLSGGLAAALDANP
jgi:CheY-like chemotaxis protein